MKENCKSEHYLFHFSRIMNILLDQQTPCNSGDKGISTHGNLKKVNRNHIFSSLAEMKVITNKERISIEKALAGVESEMS